MSGSVIFNNNELNMAVPKYASIIFSGPSGDVVVPRSGRVSPGISAVMDTIICSVPPNPPDPPLKYIFKGGDTVAFAVGLAVTVLGPNAKGVITLSDGINTVGFEV